MAEKLRKYRQMRDFRQTGEPRGRPRRRAGNRFVIQKHDARSQHYDFRLEAGGVLKSWAVPKGPSTDPREKRLAVETEDHPLEYATFEGVIPRGQYGAGTVIVWDEGSYRNLSKDAGGNIVPVDEAMDAGRVRIWLEGQKLRGGYALTRWKGGKDWLLVKMADEAADARRNPTRTQPESVRSGRTTEELSGS